jgi:hypothetical protein
VPVLRSNVGCSPFSAATCRGGVALCKEPIIVHASASSVVQSVLLLLLQLRQKREGKGKGEGRVGRGMGR